MKKLATFLRDHLADVVSIAGTVGFGTVVAAMDEARAMLLEHAVPSLLLAAFAFLLGASLARFVTETSRWARHRKRVRKLSDAFLCMPKRSKEMVARALDNGEVVAWPLDQDVQVLCQLGILGSPKFGTMTGNTSFRIQPSVARDIVRHRSEWLGI